MEQEYIVRSHENSFADWDLTLKCYQDATIYQSSAYAQAVCRTGKVEYLYVMTGNDIVAMAQVRIQTIPILGFRVAYIPWGPVWRKNKSAGNVDVYSKIIVALYKEFVLKRNCVLRIFPNVFRSDSIAQDCNTALKKLNFLHTSADRPTIILPLCHSADELRAGMRRKWRQTLNNAEKQGVTIRYGETDELIQTALVIYNEMHERKGFAEFASIQDVPAINNLLNDHLKLKTICCYLEDKPVSAIVWTSIGSTGLPLVAATGASALKTNAAYLMWWNMMLKLKESGLDSCDLGGVNKERNPGGHLFKTGLAEKYGIESDYLGFYDVSKNVLALNVITVAGKIRTLIRKYRVKK